MYPADEARVNIAKVRAALYEIFDEYVAEYISGGTEQGVETQVYDIGTKDANLKASSSGWGDWCHNLHGVKKKSKEVKSRAIGPSFFHIHAYGSC
ncbi:hypothetical protein CCACVL1_10961 [Corchorus capsularis]|uniref:Uncharacterized protein n=1 Tax=Corchorus capsularis TaxID=210143 RepID=A0A1R3INL8_COCAP|nr:hypothetical protein CCACVL1_10961 [Corchorus capsularis]